MTKPITVYLATNNPDKIRDYSIVFNQLKINLEQVPQVLPVEENADTLMENAKLKALTHSRHFTDKIIMATDGGVKIPFLGDQWNHVLTRRLSGLDTDSELTDIQRAETLLEMMQDAQTDENRKIFWEEAVVLAYNNEIIFEFISQSSPGILVREIPDNFSETGYWIGYLWFDPAIGKTYMSMSQEEKMQHSTLRKELLSKLKTFDLSLLV